MLAFLIQIAVITLYSQVAGRLPLASMYEFLLLLSLVLASYILATTEKCHLHTWGR